MWRKFRGRAEAGPGMKIRVGKLIILSSSTKYLYYFFRVVSFYNRKHIHIQIYGSNI